MPSVWSLFSPPNPLNQNHGAQPSDQARSSSSHTATATGRERNSSQGAEADIVKTGYEEDKINLGEEAALEHVRTHTQDRTPLHICFEDGDKSNPRNFSKAKKWYITIFAAWMNFSLSMSISQMFLGFKQISQDFGVSMEIATLAGITMIALGGGIGPLIWAPLSERYGRNPIYIISWGLLTVFQIPVALAPNIATVFVCRFIQGLQTAPAPNTGGYVYRMPR